VTNPTTPKTTVTRKRRRAQSTLRFNPWAWAKLSYLRDLGPTEIGGFALTDSGDPLLVTDVRLVRQVAGPASVAFDDTSVADFFDDQIDRGRRPEEFARIWVHTHPSGSARPSSVDEATFERVFGGCDWAVMAILSRTRETYARVRFAAGPGGSVELPLEVAFEAEFCGSDHAAWRAEYEACVQQEPRTLGAEREFDAPPIRGAERPPWDDLYYGEILGDYDHGERDLWDDDWRWAPAAWDELCDERPF
jgi:proteasome lid subunit RPN8/RPN11